MEQNTVNDVQGPNVEAPTEAQTQAGETGFAPPAQELARPAQTPEQNRWYAERRRETETAVAQAEALRRENRRLLESLGNRETARQQAQAPLDAGQIPARQNPGGGYAEKQGAAQAAPADPEYLRVKREADSLRRLVFETVLEKDLAAVNRANNTRFQNVRELGETFLALRANGIDAVTAYAAVKASQPQKPAEIGAVSKGGAEKEFYTPGEVDRLSPEQLDNPRVWARIRGSMTKWK